MIRYLRTVITTLLLSLNLIPAIGQSGGSIADILKSRVADFNRDYPREEVYIHSDREKYIAGEDIWFNAFVFNRQSGTLSNSSKIVYLEVLNKHNKPVIQKHIIVADGTGQGQILLPDTLSTGPYILRAYTNWMKNFLPQNCFMKEIKIHNAITLKSSGQAYYQSLRFSPKDRLYDFHSTPSIIEFRVPENQSHEVIIKNGGKIQQGNEYCLVIESAGKISFSSLGRLLTDESRVLLPESALKPGINHIVVFNTELKPVDEKFIYIPLKQVITSIIGDRDTYSKREKLRLETDTKGKIDISVVPEIYASQGISITDYFLFGSEYGMYPYEFLNGRRMSDLTHNEIDTLMMNLHSNLIDWNKISEGIKFETVYSPEKDEHYIYGRLINRNSGSVGPGNFIFMSEPGKVPHFQYSKTDAGGNFVLEAKIDGKLNDFVIQPDITTDNQIKIESSYSDRYIQAEIIESQKSADLPDYIKNEGVNFQVRKIYGTSYYGDPLPLISSSSPLPRFYGKPEMELILDDYLKLPVMEEVFFELIPGVSLKKRKAGYEISVADPVDLRFYEHPPCLMVDGVIINDPNIIGNIDPEEVQQIDIIRERYFVGDYLFYGIVSIITHRGDFSNVQLADYATRFSYRVVEPVWTFLSPEYSTDEKKKSREPDFRNTLYWKTSDLKGVNEKTSLEFWSSDIPGKYSITLEGINEKGELVSGKTTFEVK